MIYFNLKLYNWLENQVDIDSLTHFAVEIFRQLIKVYIRLEIIAQPSLTEMAFWFFSFDFYPLKYNQDSIVLQACK